MTQLIDFTVIAILIAGIWQFREPRRAKHGNLTAALALFLACILILYRNGIFDVGIVMASLLVGGVVGAYYARTVSMIQVPAMVAFQHGVGGVAAVLVSLVELSRAPHALNLASEISGILGLAIGSLTFSGSMIASAKLANKMRQAAQVLRSHRLLVLANVEALMAVGMASFWLPAGAALCLYLLEIVFGICFGILLAIRIGGADMPVLISSLNATAGIAAALCGMALENQLLIAFGATVASSGSILTYVMCKAMNRRMVKVIFPDYAPARATPAAGSEAVTSRAQSVQNPGPTDSADGFSKALSAIRAAHSAIIVPGYGMALANAQQEVVSLANALSAKGCDVKYAIHPVAGRMPGHMNVLLAEVGVDYDLLVEMEAINRDFHDTDLVLVVGACDVVNPAAIQVEGTPISGMPILMAHEAKTVVCCNFDRKPGYSGVANPLYEQDNTICLEGDAKATLSRLLQSLAGDIATREAPAKTGPMPAATEQAARLLAGAGSVIMIPGYGMALAKAQFNWWNWPHGLSAKARA